MASDDEGQGSGDCNVYEAADAYLNLLEEQQLLQCPPVTSETDGGLKLSRYFPKEEGMMQHNSGRYFPQ